MSKRRNKIDTRQLNLFEFLKTMNIARCRQGVAESTLNIRETLRLALNDAISNCQLSRHQIAGEMSHLLGKEISKSSIDAWTAESKENNRIPAEYIPAFCRATGSRRPLEIINEAAGIFALPGPDALRSEIQRFAEAERKARAEKRKRELFLEEMERRKQRP